MTARTQALVLSVGLMAAIAACGEPLPPRGPSTRPRAAAPAAKVVADAAPPSALPGRFAASPVTELANQVTDLALAALEGRNAETTLPVARIAAPTPRVERAAGAPSASELEVLAFTTWVTLVFRDDNRSLGDPSRKHGLPGAAIKAFLFLDQKQLRLANLAVDGSGQATATPRWLQGLYIACDELHRSARAGKLGSWRIGAEDRKWMPAQLSAVLAKTRPDDAVIQQAQQVAQLRPLRGIDEVSFVLLARAKDGSLWQMALSAWDLDELQAWPLVSLSPLESE